MSRLVSISIEMSEIERMQTNRRGKKSVKEIISVMAFDALFIDGASACARMEKRRPLTTLFVAFAIAIPLVTTPPTSKAHNRKEYYDSG